jgi:hypothetical protein
VKEIKKLSIAQAGAAALADGIRAGIIERAKGALPAEAAAGQAAMPAGEGGEAAAPPPDQGRYVDATGVPITGPPPPGEPFKRMPVYLELIVDQREIPKLLVECANAPMPVEVRQLRINPDQGGGGGSPAGGQAGKGGAERTSFDVPIQLSGIIYIYNPPPEEPKPEGEGAAAEATAGAAPAQGPGA